MTTVRSLAKFLLTDFKLDGRALLLCAVLIAPVGGAILIVLDEVLEYSVSRTDVSTAQAASWLESINERMPAFERIRNDRLLVLENTTPDSEKKIVRSIDRGVIEYRDFPSIEVSPQFKPEALSAGWPETRLKIAALAVADLYLEAYKVTGKSNYFARALNYTKEFIRFEYAQWLPVGMLWNDHAIASRALFLSRLLYVGALSKSLSTEDVQYLLIYLDGLVQRLSKDSQFTFRTNHGLIQSLAVLHVGILFPQLPSLDLQKIAERLDKQLEFFVTIDGVVTEHSTEYQIFGVRLLQMALSYYELTGMGARPEMANRLDRARAFTQHFMRPDQSIPTHGDSRVLPSVQLGISNDQLRLPSKREPRWLSRPFGYWSRWTRQDEHLFAVWANFPNMAHKHADDLSLTYWGAGVEWWTNSGYWPYGDSRRKKAISWVGSNGPHHSSETSVVPRTSVLVNHLLTDNVELLHLRRKNRNGNEIDRVIAVFEPGGFVVIDSSSNSNEALDSVWMTSPLVEITRLVNEERFRLDHKLSGESLLVEVAGAQGVRAEISSSGESRLLNSVVRGGEIRPTGALQISTPPTRWSSIAWQKTDGGNIDSVSFPIVFWRKRNSWELRVQDNGVSIFREEGRYKLVTGASETVFPDESISALEEQLAKHNRAYEQLTSSYQRHRYLLPWRLRVAQWLGVFAVIQFTIAILAALLLSLMFTTMTMTGLLVGWCSVIAWLQWVYLV